MKYFLILLFLVASFSMHAQMPGDEFYNLADAYLILKNRVNISKRPKIVNDKARFGDFEVDTVIGKDHKGAIVTLYLFRIDSTWRSKSSFELAPRTSFALL